jgi:hypothetical protein
MDNTMNIQTLLKFYGSLEFDKKGRLPLYKGEQKKAVFQLLTQAWLIFHQGRIQTFPEPSYRCRNRINNVCFDFVAFQLIKLFKPDQFNGIHEMVCGCAFRHDLADIREDTELIKGILDEDEKMSENIANLIETLSSNPPRARENTDLVRVGWVIGEERCVDVFMPYFDYPSVFSVEDRGPSHIVAPESALPRPPRPPRKEGAPDDKAARPTYQSKALQAAASHASKVAASQASKASAAREVPQGFVPKFGRPSYASMAAQAVHTMPKEKTIDKETAEKRAAAAMSRVEELKAMIAAEKKNLEEASEIDQALTREREAIKEAAKLKEELENTSERVRRRLGPGSVVRVEPESVITDDTPKIYFEVSPKVPPKPGPKVTPRPKPAPKRTTSDDEE